MSERRKITEVLDQDSLGDVLNAWPRPTLGAVRDVVLDLIAAYGEGAKVQNRTVHDDCDEVDVDLRVFVERDETDEEVLERELAEAKRTALEYARSQGWRPPEDVESLARNEAEASADAARIAELETRRDELLATVARLSRETPYPEELQGWESQRAAMTADVGTLRAKVAELERRLGERAPHLRKRIKALEDALTAVLESRSENVTDGEIVSAGALDRAGKVLDERSKAVKEIVL